MNSHRVIPRRCRWKTILSARIQQAGDQPLGQDEIMALMRSLFTAYARGLINLHSSAPRVLSTATEQPDGTGPSAGASRAEAPVS